MKNYKLLTKKEPEKKLTLFLPKRAGRETRAELPFGTRVAEQDNFTELLISAKIRLAFRLKLLPLNMTLTAPLLFVF